EQNSSGRCEPCRHGEYMEYPNAFQWCRDCWKCREDQVELSHCQPVRNTECACRNGTFCPPDHPCEMCQKCRPRCPEGQVVLKPCTPHSDLQCGPATDTGTAYLWAIIPGAVILFVMVFCIWKHCCSSPGGCRGPPEHPPWPGAGAGPLGEMVKDGKICSLQSLQSSEDLTLMLSKHSSCLPHLGACCHPRARKHGYPGDGWWRRLVPVTGNGPFKVNELRRTFYIFAKKVPKEDWKKFGRSLDLEENDIVMDMSDDAFYEMLSKWLSMEGSKSSVNTLLETLDRLHLGGVAEDIAYTLVQSGHFQYETS
ncbi:TR10A factor, partial [Cnemophilus loriae]|nr:TR10A factor [Cnemophilus loriae]